jgi:hypothetical protein
MITALSQPLIVEARNLLFPRHGPLQIFNIHRPSLKRPQRFPARSGREISYLEARKLPSDGVAPSGSRSHVGAIHLDLTDEETAALTKELHDIVESDRYPLSPRIRTLRGILAKLRLEPVREPLPPLKVYAPPSKGRYGRWRRG